MESSTKILRRLLDERGVEHYDGTENTLWGYEDYNEFTGIYRFSADETRGGYMQVRLWHVTPEQAIAATLGRGECKADKLCDGYLYYTSYWCRGCGERFAYRPIGGKDRGASPKFCPNCGAKFVGPTTNDVDAEVTDG